MAGVDAIGAVVEIAEIPAFDLHRADRQAHRPVIEQIPVHQLVERFGKRRAIVKAQRLGGSVGREKGREKPGAEKAGHAERRHHRGRGLVQRLAAIIAVEHRQRGERPGDPIPECVEPFEPALAWIARDEIGRASCRERV